MVERTRHYRTATKDSLTQRQREVLQMVADGKTNPEIAERLGITLDGAKFHIREILSKLDVTSREEAAEWWKQNRGLGTRVRSWLRGLAPAALLKPAAIGTAVGGTTLGLVAAVVAVNGGGGDPGGASEPGTVYSPLQCQSTAVHAELREVPDGRFSLYELRLSADEPCWLEAQALATLQFPPQPANYGQGPTGSEPPTPVLVKLGPESQHVATALWANWCWDELPGTVVRVEVQPSFNAAPGAPAPIVATVEASTFPECDSPNRPTGILLSFTATHVVQAGETLPGIARQYRVPEDLIVAANPGLRAEELVVGQELIVPQPPVSSERPPATPTAAGQIILCDARDPSCPPPAVQRCDFPGCLVAAELLRAPGLWLSTVKGRDLDPANEGPEVYRLALVRERVSVLEFVREATSLFAVTPTLIAIGDAQKDGVLDLVFEGADGHVFSIAIEPGPDNSYPPIGITYWDDVPGDQGWAETSFGTAFYRHLPE